MESGCQHRSGFGFNGQEFFRMVPNNPWLEAEQSEKSEGNQKSAVLGTVGSRSMVSTAAGKSRRGEKCRTPFFNHIHLNSFNGSLLLAVIACLEDKC